MFELRGGLLQERFHPNALIFRGECRVEKMALKLEALGQRRLERGIDTSLRDRDDRLRVAGNLCGRGDRVVEQAGGGHDTRDQPALQGFLGAHQVPSEHQLHRARLAESAREALRAAKARDGAKLDLRLAELSGVCGEDEVAAHRELTPAAQREAVDRGDDRLAQLRDLVHLLEQLRLVHVHVVLGAHGLDVRARGERLLPRPRQHQRPNRLVSVERHRRMRKLRDELGAEGVERLGAVEGDETDRSARLARDVAVRARAGGEADGGAEAAEGGGHRSIEMCAASS
mmetsp:Transcript_34825/g.79650  ORF Transcript_34825/g.79650 Transcript_34825/m.79650 type:complete len:286 (+) Transcript_34825:311-1168(+)